ncbi:MAG TPA: TonB-dependent receptor, partial [Candidatus Sulfotelmatobacter sp.]|nr:TonB-dependent receptor [Candidatus Sulfotelmatobacter sp.]
MPHSPAVRLLVLSILTTAFAATALAQKDMGNIVGLVKDSTGAVVAGAKVTITDADRGTSVETTTDVQGAYVAGPLKIGRYSVTVEKQGFKKAVAGPLELNVQDRLAVDVTLQVGTVSETMTITTEGPQLETETSELGQVVNGQTATALPLNGRNFAQLAQIAAGVAPNEPGARTETTFGFSSNGARALENNFLLDGVDNNAYLGDVLNFSAYVIQPSIDAIGEFKVETNSYSAEFGRGNGAIMNAVIKSGTNRFHGEALEFIRNDKFDGKNAFDLFGRRQYQQNQFGANLGGPIIKGRTFFFADYEGLRIRQALPTLALIPTPQQLSGNFSSFLNLSSQIAGVVDCSGNPTFTGEMFNPRLTQAFAGNPTGFCGVPIAVNGTGVPTNMFPATGPSAIATPAANLAALFPAPNISFEGNNFLVDPKKSLNQNNFDIRIDHRFTDKDNFFARFSYEDQPLFVPGPFTTVLDGGGFVAGHQDNSYRSVAISELHTFTPNLLNEVRLGYSRVNSQRSEPNANTNVAAQIGIPGVPFTPGFGGLPSMCFFDYACIGTNDFLPAIEKQNSFVINENLTWTHGRHSVKFGTELRREEFTILEDSAPRGDMTFTPDFSGNPGAPMGTAPGDDIASFLLGVPDAADIVNVHGPDYRRNIAAFFAQDDFRATNRLTLNLGIRYDLYRPITEGKNQQATFDFRSDTLFV